MSRRVSRLPYVLLGLMTLATFGGPLGFGAVLRGGASPNWPPDRAVEWWTLGATSGLVLVLMVTCIAVGLANSRQWRRAQVPGDHGREPVVRTGAAANLARECDHPGE